MRRNTPSSRRAQFVNALYYLFTGSRQINMHVIPPKAQKKWLKGGGLVQQRRGVRHLSLSNWGQYNKYTKNGFGKQWSQLLPAQRGRIIKIFIRANLENAFFPSPFPEGLKRAPYNAKTRTGMIQFFLYAGDMYDSFRVRERKRFNSASPEVRDTAVREYFLYRNLVLAHRAVAEAIRDKRVRW